MRGHAPWQALLAAIFVHWAAYGLIALFAIACIWFGWPYVSAIALLAGFATLSMLGPFTLSWTRRSFTHLIAAHLGHQALAVLVYAAHYSMAGLTVPTSGAITRSFWDAVYVSLAMWTTLGTNDYAVPKYLQLLTAIEALTAVLFVPIFAANVWQMLHESTAPPEEAYLDRKQRERDRNKIHTAP